MKTASNILSIGIHLVIGFHSSSRRLNNNLDSTNPTNVFSTDQWP